jgi:hypothetical protein
MQKHMHTSAGEGAPPDIVGPDGLLDWEELEGVLQAHGLEVDHLLLPLTT